MYMCICTELFIGKTWLILLCLDCSVAPVIRYCNLIAGQLQTLPVKSIFLHACKGYRDGTPHSFLLYKPIFKENRFFNV